MEDQKNIQFKVENASDIVALVNYLSKTYGDVLSVRLVDNADYYTSYYDINDLLSSNPSLTKVKQVFINIKPPVGDLLICEANIKEKKVIIRSIKRDIVLPKVYDKFDDISQFIDDPTCRYYKFENGIAFKFNPQTNQYFVLDRQNGWVLDNKVVTWMHDNNMDYVEINSDLRSV